MIYIRHRDYTEETEMLTANLSDLGKEAEVSLGPDKNLNVNATREYKPRNSLIWKNQPPKDHTSISKSGDSIASILFYSKV